MIDRLVEVATPQCFCCGKGGSVWVSDRGLQAWLSGTHIQVALGDVDAAIREQLMTGMHPACWDATIGGDDDE